MNTFGRIFRISIFGESHGENVGVLIDGCPSGIDITVDELMKDLERRKSGAKGTTSRQESDIPRIISGVFNDKTTGAPITIIFKNTNVRSKDYNPDIPRPGHADFVANQKYKGFNDYRGGGHFSGRITLGLVAAGVIAKKIIAPIEVSAKLIEAGGSTNIDQAIENALIANDSIGGLISCQSTNMPVGLGEPFFDSVESLISHAVFSIPAVKGIEFGSGFEAARMTGSLHNDRIIDINGETSTNNAGGINGGISNGNDLLFKVAIKPTSSISVPQKTINLKTGEMDTLQVEGRHDACIALRVPVIIETVTAIVLADLEMVNG